MSSPEHDSERRHAAHCNRRPRRRLGDGRDGESLRVVQPREEAGVDHGSRRGVVFPCLV
jgi:hypothetical protein